MSTIFKSLAKFNTAILLAATVTLLLFYTMQKLISFNGEIPSPTSQFVNTRITIPDFKIEIIPTAERPEKIEPIDPPKVESIRTDSNTSIEVPRVFVAPVVEPVDDPTFNGLGTGDALPLVQIQPTYPQSALQRGTEGYVILTFNISAEGLVEDAQVLASEPPRVFDNAALKAIARWKYNPKVVNGKNVRTFGVQQKMVFAMSD